jgi:hypothetical protein
MHVYTHDCIYESAMDLLGQVALSLQKAVNAAIDFCEKEFSEVKVPFCLYVCMYVCMYVCLHMYVSFLYMTSAPSYQQLDIQIFFTKHRQFIYANNT